MQLTVIKIIYDQHEIKGLRSDANKMKFQLIACFMALHDLMLLAKSECSEYALYALPGSQGDPNYRAFYVRAVTPLLRMQLLSNETYTDQMRKQNF